MIRIVIPLFDVKLTNKATGLGSALAGGDPVPSPTPQPQRSLLEFDILENKLLYIFLTPKEVVYLA